MSLFIRYGLFIFCCWFIANSCKKEYSCENCIEANKRPIANAGTDQIISLPNDSALLDGSQSTDTDGTISFYRWTKISGPVSNEISRADSSKSLAKKLTFGIYEFELMVTDNGGLSAKDTVQITIVDPAVNHPPIACAGPDKTVLLPLNGIVLDGTCSFDPDNNITSYVWTKISGPSAAGINNGNSVKPIINCPLKGIYLFELKVTDAGGLLSKDTVQIAVNEEFCDNTNLSAVNARLIELGRLSEPRWGFSTASVNNKILFAGGFLDDVNSSPSSKVDMYDIVTQQWSTATIKQARGLMGTVVAENKIFFSGGVELDFLAQHQAYSNVDIYDAGTHTWSQAMLSGQRGIISSATVGNKVFFTGGVDLIANTPLDRVDIYDLSNDKWTTFYLSEPRAGMAATTVGEKIYFAGGMKPNGDATDKIDIYDNTTNSWSTSTLSKPMASATTADFLNVGWGVAKNQNIYWAMGCHVEIRNTITGQRENANLAQPSTNIQAVIRNNQILFFRGSQFDIYDIATNSWSIGRLPINVERYSVISVNNTVYLAGGWETVNCQDNLMDKIWKLEF